MCYVTGKKCALRRNVAVIGTLCESLFQLVVMYFQIRRSCSGPAITLKVSTTLCDKPIDVDLVPVFRFKNNEKWPTTIEDISEQFPRVGITYRSSA